MNCAFSQALRHRGSLFLPSNKPPPLQPTTTSKEFYQTKNSTAVLSIPSRTCDISSSPKVIQKHEGFCPTHSSSKNLRNAKFARRILLTRQFNSPTKCSSWLISRPTLGRMYHQPSKFTICTMLACYETTHGWVGLGWVSSWIPTSLLSCPPTIHPMNINTLSLSLSLCLPTLFGGHAFKTPRVALRRDGWVLVHRPQTCGGRLSNLRHGPNAPARLRLRLRPPIPEGHKIPRSSTPAPLHGWHENALHLPPPQPAAPEEHNRLGVGVGVGVYIVMMMMMMRGGVRHCCCCGRRRRCGSSLQPRCRHHGDTHRSQTPILLLPPSPSLPRKHSSKTLPTSLNPSQTLPHHKQTRRDAGEGRNETDEEIKGRGGRREEDMIGGWGEREE